MVRATPHVDVACSYCHICIHADMGSHKYPQHERAHGHPHTTGGVQLSRVIGLVARAFQVHESRIKLLAGLQQQRYEPTPAFPCQARIHAWSYMGTSTYELQQVRSAGPADCIDVQYESAIWAP